MSAINRKEYKDAQREKNHILTRFVDILPMLDPNSTVAKCIADPDYTLSAEFVIKHANFKDNGDGTMTISRPVPYQRES
jgi:hypothetical protein